MRKILGISLASLLLVMGCTTTKTTSSMSLTQNEVSTPTQSWENRELALKRIRSWYLSGKIAVQAAQNSGSAAVNWSQGRSGQYNVSLYGPLGAGSVKLAGRRGSVTMETADGKHFTAGSAEQLLKQQLGWNLPVSNLNYWVRGLPVPGVPYNSQFDNANRITSMTQQGWNIEYLDYTNKNGIDLPQKMAISTPGLKSKIVIYQWSIAG